MATNARMPGTAVVCIIVAAGAIACAPGPRLRSAPTRDTDSVAVGYGSQPRDRVTGSIASIDEARIEREKALDIVDLLERVPGLRVTRAGHDFTVRVRNATVEPLVVIDGQPLRGAMDALAALRPSDVERIDILQDAGAAAVYGLSGANGVIVVRTRLH